jgi:hypothetical protein
LHLSFDGDGVKDRRFARTGTLAGGGNEIFFLELSKLVPDSVIGEAQSSGELLDSHCTVPKPRKHFPRRAVQSNACGQGNCRREGFRVASA